VAVGRDCFRRNSRPRQGHARQPTKRKRSSARVLQAPPPSVRLRDAAPRGVGDRAG